MEEGSRVEDGGDYSLDLAGLPLQLLLMVGHYGHYLLRIKGVDGRFLELAVHPGNIRSKALDLPELPFFIGDLQLQLFPSFCICIPFQLLLRLLITSDPIGKLAFIRSNNPGESSEYEFGWEELLDPWGGRHTQFVVSVDFCLDGLRVPTLMQITYLRMVVTAFANQFRFAHQLLRQSPLASSGKLLPCLLQLPPERALASCLIQLGKNMECFDCLEGLLSIQSSGFI